LVTGDWLLVIRYIGKLINQFPITSNQSPINQSPVTNQPITNQPITSNQSPNMLSKPYVASLINGIVCLLMGFIGYFMSENPSPTALIPAGFGLIFLIATPAMSKNNKVVAHIVVVLTFLLLLSLIMPLKGAFGRDNMGAVARIVAMMVTCIVAMIAFMKSFRAARIARESGKQ
jgi:hypothetical protein